MSKKLISSIVFQSAFIIVCLLGIVLFIHRNGAFFDAMSYFTLQSNVLCLIVMAISLFRTVAGSTSHVRSFHVVKTGTTVAILVTFIVYHFILRPVMIQFETMSDTPELSSILVHYVAPLWFFANYLLFEPKGALRESDGIFFYVFPVIYISLVFASVFIGNRWGIGDLDYPYPFLDPGVIGWLGVMTAITVIAFFVNFMADLFIVFELTIDGLAKRRLLFRSSGNGQSSILSIDSISISVLKRKSMLIDANESVI
ncbi:MAG TPA: hypothetical protein DCR44_03180 [Acholeplasmatales bacterium]|nr:MAG: hypothetical protein A2Y16_04560 [Tenericutes bacterium GWF2_57_13]HAQ56394.1 hypothetical protein [Acholeplasmatales bacterium]